MKSLTALGPMTDFKLAMSVQEINRAIAVELQTLVQTLGMTTDEDEQAVMTQEFLSKTADLFMANLQLINIDEFKFNFGTDEFINLTAELKLNKDKVEPSSIALIQQLGLAGASILIPALEFRMDTDRAQQALTMVGAMSPALAATLFRVYGRGNHRWLSCAQRCAYHVAGCSISTGALLQPKWSQQKD